MSKRDLAIVVCAVIAVGGFGGGFASLLHRHHDRRERFERHVAQVCVDAAFRARGMDHGPSRLPVE